MQAFSQGKLIWKCHEETDNSLLGNWSPPGQNGHHFTDDIFRCIFMNEKFGILIQIALKFVPKGPFDNKAALVQVMAWCRIGNEPLSEPMLTRLTNAYMQHSGGWVKWHCKGYMKYICYDILHMGIHKGMHFSYTMKCCRFGSFLSKKTRISLFHIVNIMTVDAMVMQGTYHFSLAVSL